MTRIDEGLEMSRYAYTGRPEPDDPPAVTYSEDVMREKFYNEIVKVLRSENLPEILSWMAYHSQSLILNYGEDNQLWECSWILSGERRVTSVEKTPLEAVKAVLSEVRTKILTREMLTQHT